MGQLSHNTLQYILRISWDKSSSVAWNQRNPAQGQCVATSFVVQDYFKGEIEEVNVTFGRDMQVAHFRNCVNGHVIDFTRDQFPTDANYQCINPNVCRDELLGEEFYLVPYRVLRKRVRRKLARSSQEFWL